MYKQSGKRQGEEELLKAGVATGIHPPVMAF
jgi:hypothetical protein